MSGGRFFLDTNIFVYTFDPVATAKAKTAEDLIGVALRDHRGVISFQIVQEFCATALRKFPQPLRPGDVLQYVRRILLPLCEVHSSSGLYETTLDICQRTGYSYHDSLILAAAAQGGCDTLYTEDLQHGQVVGGVKIVNPFVAV